MKSFHPIPGKRAYRLDPTKRRPANRVLPMDKVLLIETLAYEGHGQRDISRLTGLSKNSVKNYFPRDAVCECGRLLVEHKGWCKVRYKKSAARQAVFPPRKP